MSFTCVSIERNYKVSTIWLNRPDVRNAFNEVMIAEITDAFMQEGQREDVRAIVLRGKGKVFCAGADLNWMRDVAQYGYEQNYTESLQLSECFHTIYKCPKPTLAIVHGAAMGGGNGLFAACDFAFCEAETIFSLSEVKIGIIPACISPYIIKRVGEYGARDLMLTGQRINGATAEQYKLVNKSFKDIHETEAHLQATIQLLLSSGPAAMAHCKKLIDTVCNQISMTEAIHFTAKMIAEIRSSQEGQEGMTSFLEKRKPNWIEK
ncbi:MAG TPA: enoyl-CoA hydratase-related protein [Niabella sp.]|nr:enoyl-CoA hydratase-related protein [Niabella sp.]HOZ97102.1 enoyl-CoA hydratase-related protein [Niabella sp.]HQW15302.1 enoyl-CoA hydratase-related protein [Niabella sp.]HQX20448.1 enoyl-CoA hydratase-related protein [Niabella sp.]HQX42149.1 enoyl-CoA hydratase-related protein [Niabella sp.]